MKWIIETERQDNGLWGTPHQLVKIDRIVNIHDKEKWLLQSAIMMGIAEAYRGRSFEIFNTTTDGFMVKMFSPVKYFSIKFKDYMLEGNVITWIGNNTKEGSLIEQP